MGNMGLGNVDWNNVDENASGQRDPVPTGYYTIAAAEAKMAKTKKGHMALNIMWEVQTGDHKGAKVWTDHNVNNPSEVAKQIAIQEVKKIFVSMGKPPQDDTDALLHTPIAAKVKLIPKRPKENGDGTYEPKNEIVQFYSLKQLQEMFKKEGGAPAETQSSDPAPKQESAPQTQSEAPPADSGGDDGGSMPWDN